VTTADTLAQWDDQATSAWAQAVGLVERQDRLGREDIARELQRMAGTLKDLRKQIGLEYRDQVRREARAEVASLPIGKALNAAGEGELVHLTLGSGQ